jgi:uncharacterized DUF497 family protein
MTKEIQFTWDEKKEASNRQKHGISFNEAKSVFYDENARLIHDPDHSETEDRFIILGMSTRLRLLVVVHCYLDMQGIIRIISARKATRNETKQYEEFLG